MNDFLKLNEMMDFLKTNEKKQIDEFNTNI